MKAPEGSWTAVLVCQGRAAADGLAAPGRFTDPMASSLLRGDEQRLVERVRAGRPPSRWSDRIDYESVRACAAIMAPRVTAIDDALRERTQPQIVLLGAGLDDRAWRMPELADRVVYEVDHPASQRDKLDRLAAAGAPAREEPVRFVPVDFARDRLDRSLGAAGHQADTPTTWVWEGVVPYLTRAEVTRTAAVIAALSAPASRLIVNYQASQLSILIGQYLARVANLLARRPDVWSREPWRSYWTAATMRDLLGQNGFIVGRDEDLLAIATRLGTSTTRRASLRSGRVAVADRPA